MAKAKKAKKGKKAASKLKRRKLKTSRPAPRKKVAQKAVKRNKVSRKPAPKPAKRQAPVPQSPPPAKLPGDRVGVVTHYFSHLSVAVVKLDSGTNLHVGDKIHIKGHTSDFSQRVESLQIGHAAVDQVGPDDDFGLRVVDHAREHDVVYKVK